MSRILPRDVGPDRQRFQHRRGKPGAREDRTQGAQQERDVAPGAGLEKVADSRTGDALDRLQPAVSRCRRFDEPSVPPAASRPCLIQGRHGALEGIKKMDRRAAAGPRFVNILDPLQGELRLQLHAE